MNEKIFREVKEKCQVVVASTIMDEQAEALTAYIATNFVPKDKILDMVEIDKEKTEEMLRKVLAWATEETNMDTDEILKEQARFLTEAGIIKVKEE